MKLSILFSLLLIGFLSIGKLKTIQEDHLNWLTDFEEAKELALKEDKLVFMRFQGSDWCGNCWRMDSTLFETPEFEKYVKDKFVLLALDFPAKEENKLPKAQAEHNQKLQEKYNPGKQFPAAFILTAKGETMGQMSVTPNPTAWYIEQIEAILKQ